MWRNLFLTLILFSSIAVSQTQEKPKAILHDLTGGRLGDCDLFARLTNLNEGLKEYQDSKAVVIFYQDINDLPAHFDNPRMLRSIKKQVVFSGYEESKFNVILGGFRPKSEIEFWVVPQGADAPKPTQTVPKPTLPTDKSFIYGKSLFGYDCIECETMFELLSSSAQKERIKFEKERKEENKKLEIEEDDVEDEPTYTKDEIEEMKFSWANGKFGEILKSQKDSIGTIIFYADKDEYNLKAVRAHVEEGKNRIVKESQILPNQIKIVYGGFRYSLEAEFWVTPNGAKFPTPKPKKKEETDSN